MKDASGSRLDPWSESFDYGAWLEAKYRNPSERRYNRLAVAFRNLGVFGHGRPTDYQKTFANYPLAYISRLLALITRQRYLRIDILRKLEGIAQSGELVLVLGRPGSGCTTLLKTLAGRTHGLQVDRDSVINFQGIHPDTMYREFRGECTYLAETDLHFPLLTIGPGGRNAFARTEYQTVSAALGITHTLDTITGDDFIQGVSGGERKRTSIAEILVGGSSLHCWDNATKGLDSATALQFISALKAFTRASGSVGFVNVYQASEAIYEKFDKVLLLHGGRQIFFGDTRSAKSFFLQMGFVCPERATTPDFLTSITRQVGRSVLKGYEKITPRSPDEFATVWESSQERGALLEQLQQFKEEYPLQSSESYVDKYRTAQRKQKSTSAHSSSPYTISLLQQLSLCLSRGYQRLLNELVAPISNIAGNCIMSIILGSIFYNLGEDTSSFYGRGVLLFFIVLLNTFLGAFESVALWAQKPIVEKQAQLAFAHPFLEAIASAITDIPNKILLTLFFNIPVYFLANLRRTPAAFFTFYLFSFLSLLVGSFHFRFTGSISRTITGSLAPGATYAMMLLIFTGFVLPIPSMPVWFRWFNYINPIGYAFEALMINEFSNRVFSCATFVPEGPGYSDAALDQRMCTAVGSRLGSNTVSGNEYLEIGFAFFPSHLWRNLAIIFAILVFYCTIYLLAAELVSLPKPKGDVHIFRRSGVGQIPHGINDDGIFVQDPTVLAASHRPICRESLSIDTGVEAATFIWKQLSYEVPFGKGKKEILHDVEGLVEPGSLTALMGASGAGKTTLLNVLADRTSVGVVSGEIITNSQHENKAFARKIGYAQQQDLHLPTSTVREALQFSALLRQPEKYSVKERLEYVEEVITTLNLEGFADAIIGVYNEGLNIEQKKRVTIGVELAARPELLLFLDEPTSGLDSDTAWSICRLLRKLADQGQAILCTIHQPSTVTFQSFDRLLFLSHGYTLYFGNIGANSKTVISYFEGNGARKCTPEENPAEWLLEVASSDEDGVTRGWAAAWAESDQRKQLIQHLEKIKRSLLEQSSRIPTSPNAREFAASFLTQLYLVTKRNMQQDWCTPSYLWSKVFLAIGMGIFNSLSFFHSPNSLQGLQSQLFSVFIVMTFFSNVNQLIIPRFIHSRTIYESREQSSRTYCWQVFILSNVIAEVPWQTLCAVLSFVCWYFPLGLYQNGIATDSLNERAGMTFLLLWSYMMFCSTFAQMVSTVMPDASTGVNIASLLYSLCLIFSGVLVSATALPGFWMFMYRVSPITYFVSGIISNAVAGVPIECAADEVVQFMAPEGQSCGAYLAAYLSDTSANLLNPESSGSCQVCPFTVTDQLLATLSISYQQRWRDWGISVVYSVINIAGSLLLYGLTRGRQGTRRVSLHS